MPLNARRRVRAPGQRGIYQIVPDGGGGWRLAALGEGGAVEGKFCLDHADRAGGWMPVADFYGGSADDRLASAVRMAVTCR